VYKKFYKERNVCVQVLFTSIYVISFINVTFGAVELPCTVRKVRKGRRLQLRKVWIPVDYIDTLYEQSVPHREHCVSTTDPTGQCCLGKQPLFIVRIIRNTQVHCVD
jgi:hypothetical protein